MSVEAAVEKKSLEQTATDLVGEILDTPMSVDGHAAVIAQLREVIPGAGTEEVSLSDLKAHFSTATAEQIKASLSSGASEESVRGAIELVDSLRAILASPTNGASTVHGLAAVEELMGAENVFGPDSYKQVFSADVGQVPTLPEDLAAILQEDCPFTEGKKVGDTHQLVLVPEKLDGKDFTINDLRERASKKNGCAFRDQDWYDRQDFANNPSKEGSHWSLVYKELLPDSKGKTDGRQLEEVRKHPDYETTPAIDHITDLQLDSLQNDNRRHEKEYGRLDDHGSYGYRVYVGGFGASGLGVRPSYDAYADGDLGRFVRRKLNIRRKLNN